MKTEKYKLHILENRPEGWTVLRDGESIGGGFSSRAQARAFVNEHASDLRRMLQDNSLAKYDCGPQGCGYEGNTYCQNCGYCKGERPVHAAFGAL